MKTSSAYLKVEALNIYNTILDTDQLSVIRGSSALLKEAIIELKTLQEEEHPQAGVISEGGSVGVFRFPDKRSADDFADDGRRILSREPYCYFTFSVSVTCSDSYLKAKEKLLAMSRADQLQKLRWPLPDPSGSQNQACALNGFLPADEAFEGKGGDSVLRVSRSVNTRFKKGMRLRSDLYLQETDGISEDSQLNIELDREELRRLSFSYDLNTLAGKHDEISLDKKIALIYIDGNGFGSAQREVIRKAATAAGQERAQTAFDQRLRNKRTEYLIHLVKLLTDIGATLPAGEADADSLIVQLETLLWGGDEMTLVVPAWAGMQVLYDFFEYFEGFSLDPGCAEENSNGDAGPSVTHAAGMVFCRASTPIKRVNALARQLADDIKEQREGRDHNLFDYVVLESIDYPAEDLKTFWQRRFGPLAARRRPLAFAALEKDKGKPWPEQAREQRHRLEQLPRTSAYRLLEALIQYPQELLEVDVFSSDEEREILASHQAMAGLKENQNVSSEQLKNAKRLVPLRYTRLLRSLQKAGGEDLALAGVFRQLLSADSVESVEESLLQPLRQEDATFWIHLIELYDYLAPLCPKKDQSGDKEIV